MPFRRGKALRIQEGHQSPVASRQQNGMANPTADEGRLHRLRDASCQMCERIIEANANGDLRAMAITEAWRRALLTTEITEHTEYRR